MVLCQCFLQCSCEFSPALVQLFYFDAQIWCKKMSHDIDCPWLLSPKVTHWKLLILGKEVTKAKGSQIHKGCKVLASFSFCNYPKSAFLLRSFSRKGEVLLAGGCRALTAPWWPGLTCAFYSKEEENLPAVMQDFARLGIKSETKRVFKFTGLIHQSSPVFPSFPSPPLQLGSVTPFCFNVAKYFSAFSSA